MAKLLTELLADFTSQASFDRLPPEVVHESKRIILDSIGCSIAAIDEPKGRMGIQLGRVLGGGADEATVMGVGERSSVLGAAFANGELMNTLDYDIILPPGHVTPYVLPVLLAVGESVGAPGKDIITATAISHEMSNRFGKAMDNLRDTRDGKLDTPAVFGYSSTIFGATAVAARLRGLPSDAIANALGIAACISPVQSHIPFFRHTPTTTIKYQMIGPVTQASLTAAFSAEAGHTGDRQILDDRDYGYPRFIGTRRWFPERIADGLGTHWGFPPELAYKPYAHCRVMHGLIGCTTGILEQHHIEPSEIEGIRIYVEGMVEMPAWLNREISHVIDAQFSMAHGIAVAAHRPPPGRAWQDPDLVFSPSVMELMNKVTHQVHPDYVKLLTGHGASRPARVEIRARGQLFEAEQRYPKGSNTPDPSTYMTDAELIEKFRVNANGVLAPEVSDGVVEAVMALEQVPDIGPLLRKLARGAQPTDPG